MAIRARWKGKAPGEEDREYHSGIPAQNLSDEDYEALDTEQRAVVRSSPLYAYTPKREQSSAREAEPAPAEPVAPAEGGGGA